MNAKLDPLSIEDFARLSRELADPFASRAEVLARFELSPSQLDALRREWAGKLQSDPYARARFGRLFAGERDGNEPFDPDSTLMVPVAAVDATLPFAGGVFAPSPLPIEPRGLAADPDRTLDPTPDPNMTLPFLKKRNRE